MGPGEFPDNSGIHTLETRKMEVQLPQFDPSTLLHLTKTIEGNLKKPIGKPPKIPRPPRAKQEQRPVTADQRSKKVSSVGVKSSWGSKKQDAGEKKRPDGGKNQRSVAVRSSVNTIKLGSRPGNHTSVSRSRLEEEVLALGGEKDDFELIADLGSESEMEERTAPASNRLQQGLKRDLHRLVMDLGISRLEKKDLSSSSEADEQEHQGIDQNTALQARGTPSIKAAAEKQPRRLAATGSLKLVISSWVISPRMFQFADSVFAATGTASSMAFDRSTFHLFSGSGGCDSQSRFCRCTSSTC